MYLPRSFPRPAPGLAAAVAVAVLVLLALAGRGCARGTIAARVRHAAAARGLDASWRRLDLGFPLHVRVTGLALVRTAGRDTVFRAESLAVTLDPWRALLLRPVPRAVTLARARARLARGAAAAADTLAPDADDRDARARARSARVHRIADAVARAALVPARALPRIEVHDLTLEAPVAADGDGASALRLERLALTPRAGGVSLEGAGALVVERTVPFDVALRWERDDRLWGGARCGVPDPATGALDTLRLGVDGTLVQDRRAGVARLGDSTRVWVGDLPFTLAAALARRGPAVRVRLAADGLTGERVQASLPRPVLGPLTGLAVRGGFGYRFVFDLDLARPDSVDFHADVLPRGLSIDAARTRLSVLGLDQPFTATVHLPRGRRVTRELSGANPHFLPLERLDTTLVHAVVANEDGGFFRHRGFNTEAVRGAITDNLRAGAFKRGAGTITMQLARNLWLGHERTLSRKGQEVVLAWVLEHLTGLTKQRLLEIYFNIIEWGPDVHGADEAARFYFGHGAGRLSVAEALFMAIVVPSPSKWRWRFDRDGALRPFARAHMHFIGRAMVAKGWLDPARLPPADSLRVEVQGPARALLFPQGEPVPAAPLPDPLPGEAI